MIPRPLDLSLPSSPVVPFPQRCLPHIVAVPLPLFAFCWYSSLPFFQIFILFLSFSSLFSFPYFCSLPLPLSLIIGAFFCLSLPHLVALLSLSLFTVFFCLSPLLLVPFLCFAFPCFSYSSFASLSLISGALPLLLSLIFYSLPLPLSLPSFGPVRGGREGTRDSKV